MVENKNIVIINTAFLGDVALSVYFVDKVKQIFPDSIISFITTPQAAAIVNCFKNADNVFAYDKRVSHKGLHGFKEIRKDFKNPIDIVFALHKSMRTTILTKYLKPKFSISFDNSAFSFLYSSRVKYHINLHEIDRNLLQLENFTKSKLRYNQENAELVFNETDQQFVSEQINKYNLQKFICIAPGSVWETKKWKVKHFKKIVEMISEIGYQTVLLGSVSEYNLCESIKSDNSINFAGILNLPQSMLMISQSKAVISNDSAPTHFAGIMNTPVVSIFGPTIPEFGFAPHKSNSRIAQIDDLKCRPCSIHGTKQCPIKSHECMENITPEKVLALLKEIL